MEEFYQKLMKEMPEIAKVVSAFPEPVQPKAFDVLFSALSKGVSGGMLIVTEPTKSQEVIKAIENSTSSEIPGIATKTSDGKIHISIRDIKASSALDATKKLTYVTIRAYSRLMSTESVSRKEIINPILSYWRVYDGNARNFLANDPGLIRNEDLYSLDKHAQEEAEKYMQDIVNPDILGAWKPGPKRSRKKSNEMNQDESVETTERDSEHTPSEHIEKKE